MLSNTLTFPSSPSDTTLSSSPNYLPVLILFFLSCHPAGDDRRSRELLGEGSPAVLVPSVAIVIVSHRENENLTEEGKAERTGHVTSNLL